MKTLKKILIILIIALPTLYIAGWYTMAHLIERQLDTLDQASDITFSPAPSNVEGFPYWPRIRYTGTIKTPRFDIQAIGMLATIGADSLGITTKLDFPNGFILRDTQTNTPHEFQASHIELEVPLSPALKGQTKRHMEEWRDAGGQVSVSSLHIQKDDIKISGEGDIKLDQNLQPDGIINLKIRGYQQLLTELQQAKMIRTIPQDKLNIATSLIGALTGQPDFATNKNAQFSAPMVIKNQLVYIGPMRVGKIQKISWPE